MRQWVRFNNTSTTDLLLKSKSSLLFYLHLALCFGPHWRWDVVFCCVALAGNSNWYVEWLVSVVLLLLRPLPLRVPSVSSVLVCMQLCVLSFHAAQRSSTVAHNSHSLHMFLFFFFLVVGCMCVRLCLGHEQLCIGMHNTPRLVANETPTSFPAARLRHLHDNHEECSAKSYNLEIFKKIDKCLEKISIYYYAGWIVTKSLQIFKNFKVFCILENFCEIFFEISHAGH